MKVLTDPKVPYWVIVRKDRVGAPPEQTLMENGHTLWILSDQKTTSDESCGNKPCFWPVFGANFNEYLNEFYSRATHLPGFITRMCGERTRSKCSECFLAGRCLSYGIQHKRQVYCVRVTRACYRKRLGVHRLPANRHIWGSLHPETLHWSSSSLHWKRIMLKNILMGLAVFFLNLCVNLIFTESQMNLECMIIKLKQPKSRRRERILKF